MTESSFLCWMGLHEVQGGGRRLPGWITGLGRCSWLLTFSDNNNSSDGDDVTVFAKGFTGFSQIFRLASMENENRKCTSMLPISIDNH